MARLNFEERNRNSYQKVSDVPRELINRYKGVLPEELIKIWETMGFGIYEDGFFQLVNPDEYEFVFDYVDKVLEPSIVWAITALGDIVLWEGNRNWTISQEEGNRNVLINVRKCNSHVIGDMKFLLGFILGDEYGQCYGYVPAIALGGSTSAKNIKIVDAKIYIDIIGQAVGKIIDLS